MSKGKWILLNGENTTHKCALPNLVENRFYGTTLQKRHAGSIWKCECNLKYKWLGKKWGKL